MAGMKLRRCLSGPCPDCKDHDSLNGKAHDRTASGMTERPGAMVKLVAVNGGRENRHTFTAAQGQSVNLSKVPNL